MPFSNGFPRAIYSLQRSPEPSIRSCSFPFVCIRREAAGAAARPAARRGLWALARDAVALAVGLEAQYVGGVGPRGGQRGLRGRRWRGPVAVALGPGGRAVR